MIALPLAILLFSGLAFGIVDGTRQRNGWIAVGCLASAMVATVVLGVNVWQNGPKVMQVGGWEPGIGIALHVDLLGVTFAVLAQCVLLAALTYEVLDQVGARIFPALVLFEAVGLTGLFFTGDVFNFYVFFEISMMAAYVLVGYGETPRQFRAAFVFITVNLLGSVLFLIGISATYHTTGYLDMVFVRDSMGSVQANPAVLTATIIFVAFCIKLGLFPFHFWLPAVYTGTRPAVAAILSGALANVGTYGLLRFGVDIFPRELHEARHVLMVLGAASILYGGLQAISRHASNEVIAYSAIGQVGYFMVALAIGGRAGWAAVVLYTVLNSLNKTALFLAAPLRGWMADTAVAIGAFSVAGVPPIAGFFGKLAMFRIAAEGHHWLIVLLIFCGGALSFLYMFQLYRRRQADEHTEQPIVSGQHVLVLLLGVALFFVGIVPGPLLQLATRASEALVGGGG